SHCFLDEITQPVGRKRLISLVFFPVNEETRRSGYAQSVGALAVLKNSLRHRFAAQVTRKAIYIKPDLSRIVDERWHHVLHIAPGLLIFVKLVVHCPEIVFAL